MERNQAGFYGLVLICLLQLGGKVIKIVKTVFLIFKKLRKDMETIYKKKKIRLLGMKTAVSDKKITLEGSRFDIVKEKISEVEDRVIENIQNKTQRENRIKKIKFFYCMQDLSDFKACVLSTMSFYYF